MQSGKRVLGLDLLRMIAISLVLISHFVAIPLFQQFRAVPLWVMQLGFLGVELFFVLSGFLIGNLLLDICVRRPTFEAWAIFLLRRLMRTVPAYLLWLIVLLVLLPPLDPVVHFATYMAFAQNLAWPFPADGWFAVSWSLTVEEWFYFLFSAMMFAFVNAVGRRGAPLTILVFLIAPLFLRTIMPDAAQWDASIRKTVLLRLDAIAYGVALALWMRRSAFLDRYWQGALVVGLGLLALAIGNWQFRTGVWEIEGRFWRSLIFSFTSIGFALVFPAFLRFSATPGPTVTVITAVSTYSYGAYLVHYSILERLAPWMSGSVPLCITILGIAGVLTFALAYISFRFVERPILARRPIQRWMDKPGRYDLIG